MTGDLLFLARFKVVPPDVEATITIGGVVDMVIVPYRPLIATSPAGELS
jgi:hypothetical protein